MHIYCSIAIWPDFLYVSIAVFKQSKPPSVAAMTFVARISNVSCTADVEECLVAALDHLLYYREGFRVKHMSKPNNHYIGLIRAIYPLGYLDTWLIWPCN